MDDAKIVELYLARDESAISETSAKYGARLRGIADRILDDLTAAEECENDTYLVHIRPAFLRGTLSLLFDKTDGF